ncbi:hypothetical protein H0H92_004014 [Tricholoma furcatifolium]|nr:hypothetical protein H0H92_004014 [Tricholoma furcatifolium]
MATTQAYAWRKDNPPPFSCLILLLQTSLLQSGTLPSDQDNVYAQLHALEQGLTTSNLSQQALSQQISVVQAQLKELLAAVCPTPQVASHGPTTAPDTSSNPPLDPPGFEPLPVAIDTPLPPATPSNTLGCAPAIKAAAPPFYDGDHTQGHQFLTACKLYISLNCSLFTDPSAMIRWTLSYMNTGRAADLAQEILEAPTLHFLDWSSFET